MYMNSQYELYKLLEPVFNVKKRMNGYYNKNISDKDMWKILSNRWKNSHDLSLCEIVNDILLFEGNGLNEKE